MLYNTLPDHNRPLDSADVAGLEPDIAREVESLFQLRHEYGPTPLRSLRCLAQRFDVGALYIKDESTRLGLGSFKALGGSYAVTRLVLEVASRQLGRSLELKEVYSSTVRNIARTMTFACATDGNHGKSVAAGARLVGAKAIIFVHKGVSADRSAAIEGQGAHVVRVEGTYDDAVEEAERLSNERRWHLVADTSWAGYERVPRLVMQGYTAMLSEATKTIPEAPTHIFIQAGVGGLAAAVAAYFDISLGNKRPTLTVVEPTRAACLYESVRAGERLRIAPSVPTIMAMLECYEPSLIAWRILSRKADAFMTVDEEDAIAAMQLLAHPIGSDPKILSGESGAVGLAGLNKVSNDGEVRRKLGITRSSRILLINTEGPYAAQVHDALNKKNREQVSVD